MWLFMATQQDKSFEKFFKALGQRIRALRLERSMVQEDMMNFGFSTRHYQRIEAGLPINIKTALRLCKAFKIDLPTLFKGI